jgi:hypothetical protein
MPRARQENVHAEPLEPRPEPSNTCVENDCPRAKPRPVIPSTAVRRSRGIWKEPPSSDTDFTDYTAFFRHRFIRRRRINTDWHCLSCYPVKISKHEGLEEPRTWHGFTPLDRQSRYLTGWTRILTRINTVFSQFVILSGAKRSRKIYFLGFSAEDFCFFKFFLPFTPIFRLIFTFFNFF